jgi:threonine-phosphate decarboxylase
MKIKSQTTLATESLTVDRTHGSDNREGLIDFSTSLNPLGPPPEAFEAYRQAAASISLYPPPYPRALESRIADWLGVNTDCVLATNGSMQLIYLVARVLKLRSFRVVTPTFSEIANALVAAGSTPWPLQTSCENNFRFDPSAVHAALRSGADGIFLGRPKSPTGSLISLEGATEIAVQCHRFNAWCVFDEAFIEFADDPYSVVDLVKSFSKLLVVRSLTKVFAIPGLRRRLPDRALRECSNATRCYRTVVGQRCGISGGVCLS